MFTSYYRDYLDETIALARSLCIKEPLTAVAQNQMLEAMGYPVGLDPRTWKYYLNLAGEYHASDIPMTVVSSDTKTTIPFTKQALVNHPITREEYGPNGPYYRQLCDQYPGQVVLIQRILRPIDIDLALDADDWTILDHDPRWVGVGETTLIKEIQRWITAHSTRWHITSFGVTHGLYPASMLAVMYQHLVPAIINIRASLSRTSQAADFHIWSYLGSRLRLDRFREYLDHRQAMYLYQNIDYIQWHVGKERTMLDLQTHITEPTNLIATRYDVAQSDTNLIERRTSDPLFLSSPYAAPDPETGIENRWSVSHGLAITRDVAQYNDEDLDGDIATLDRDVSAKIIDTLPTGLVEMNVNTPVNEIVFSPEAIRFNLWLYLAHQRQYQTKYEISLGELGTLSITPLEAVYLLVYASYKEKGLDIETMPSLRIGQLPANIPPTVSELESELTRNIIRRGYPTAFVNRWVPVTPAFNANELVDQSYRLSSSLYSNWLLAKEPGYSADGSIMADMHQKYYPHRVLDFGSLNFAEWVTLIELPVSKLRSADYYKLARDLLRVVGGIDLDTDGVSKRHRAMMDIMKLLTSYGIIFVDGEQLQAEQWVELQPLEPISNGFEIEETHRVPMGLKVFDVSTEYRQRTEGSVDQLILDKEWTWERSSTISQGLDIHRRSSRNAHHYLTIGGLMPGIATTDIE